MRTKTRPFSTKVKDSQKDQSWMRAAGESMRALRRLRNHPAAMTASTPEVWISSAIK